MSLQQVIQRLAQGLSIVFHPIFIPLAMTYIILETSPFRYPMGDYRFIVPLLLTGIFT